MIEYKRLISPVSTRNYADILRLLTTLYGALPTRPTQGQVNETAENNHLAVAQDHTGAIVGMATLVVYRQFAKVTAVVEDVAVMPDERGKGIGSALMEVLQQVAFDQGAKTVDLVTDQHRTEAVALYEKLTFEKRDRVNFRKLLTARTLGPAKRSSN
jgi:ribosomal protein S18 acetylase RimI-like enzyme